MADFRSQNLHGVLAFQKAPRRSGFADLRRTATSWGTARSSINKS